MEAIHQFFTDRKAAWLKAKAKSDATDEEKAMLEQQANQRFNLSTWLPDAAKRAKQLSIVSHPSKFSHPSARTTPIIARAKPKFDGYFRTGNIEYDLDAFGNAAAMDVYKFLSLPMPDGQSILEHLEADTVEIKSLMHIPNLSYSELRDGFLSVKQSDGNKVCTDRLVKQVFFPISDNQYHLLSLLTPSGVIAKLKNTIDEMRFSEQAKEARDCRKKGIFHQTGFDDIPDLTVTGYGGTQPQNISVLNSQNAGRAYLLMSAPPIISRRSYRLPSRDFFSQSLKPQAFKEVMRELHQLIKEEENNKRIRDAIGNLIRYVSRLVLIEVQLIRESETGWSAREHYRSLDESQRIWLDDAYQVERSANDDWQKKLARQFSRWFVSTYKSALSTEAIILSDHELLHIEHLIADVLSEDWGALQ